MGLVMGFINDQISHSLHKNIHSHHLGIYWVCRWKRIKLS